jgi:hypothetical protein
MNLSLPVNNSASIEYEVVIEDSYLVGVNEIAHAITAKRGYITARNMEGSMPAVYTMLSLNWVRFTCWKMSAFDHSPGEKQYSFPHQF